MSIVCICRCDGIGRRSGLKIHRWRQRTGSSPVTGTTSEQALYRLLRLFLQKSERAHAAAPPFQIEPAALGFDLVLGASLEAAGIYTAVIFHVGAKSALLRRLFIPETKKAPSTRSHAPPFQLRPAPLAPQLVDRPAAGIFSIQTYPF